MNRIYQYFSNLSNRSNFTSLTMNVNVNNTVNKVTSVCTFSINSVDTLFDNILYFFIDLSLQTRKGEDFSYWALALYLHKLGYFILKKDEI